VAPYCSRFVGGSGKVAWLHGGSGRAVLVESTIPPRATQALRIRREKILSDGEGGRGKRITYEESCDSKLP
jgi:hypothetical protein